MVARIPANQPRKATEDWISTHANARITKTDFVYAVTLKHKFIGIIGLHRSTNRDLFELGYWICPKAWGKGYATEAGKAVLLNLERSHVRKKPLVGILRIILPLVRIGKIGIYSNRRRPNTLRGPQ